MSFSAEEMELRRTGITGTDAAAIFGFNSFFTISDIWMMKKHPEAFTFTPTPLMEWGTRMEPVVIKKYEDDNGVTVKKPKTFRNSKYPWVVGSPDGILLELPDKGLEIKTAMEFSRKKWGPTDSDHIPEQYICQCAHYMLLTGRTQWDVAVLIGGWDYRVYRLFADKEFQEMLLEEERIFYERYVIGHDSPPLDYGMAVRDYIKRRWPEDNGSTITITDDDSETIAQLEALMAARAAYKPAEQAKKTAEENIKLLMKDYAELDWPSGGIRITWKNNKASEEIDWEGAFKSIAETSTLTDPEKRALLKKFTKRKQGARQMRVYDKESE